MGRGGEKPMPKSRLSSSARRHWAVQPRDEALLWLKHMGSTALASPSPVPTVSHDTTLYESKSQRFC